jgi:hypothetical protein
VIGHDFENHFGYFRIDVESGRASPIILYPSPGNLLNPMGPESSWSADSRRVYFRRHPNAPSQGRDLENLLVEVDVFTGEERVLANAAAPDTIPSAVTRRSHECICESRLALARPKMKFAIVARNLVMAPSASYFVVQGSVTLNISPDGRWLGVTSELSNYDAVPTILSGSCRRRYDPVELSGEQRDTQGTASPPLICSGARARGGGTAPIDHFAPPW